MPSLKHALLCSYLYWSIDCIHYDEVDYLESFKYGVWGLHYSVPGQQSIIDPKWPPEISSECHQIQWSVREWRPDPELHTMFQDIGRPQHGPKLIEDLVGDEHGHNLARVWESKKRFDGE
jgi:hypothetical protein